MTSGVDNCSSQLESGAHRPPLPLSGASVVAGSPLWVGAAGVSSVLLDGDCPDGRRLASLSSTQLLLSCTSEFVVFRFFAGVSVSSSPARRCLVPAPTLAGGTVPTSHGRFSNSPSPPGTLLAAVTAARNGFQSGGRCDCVVERPLATESEAEKQLVGCVRSGSLVSGTVPRSSDITVESGRRMGDCRLPDGDTAPDCLLATLIGG